MSNFSLTSFRPKVAKVLFSLTCFSRVALSWKTVAYSKQRRSFLHGMASDRGMCLRFPSLSLLSLTLRPLALANEMTDHPSSPGNMPIKSDSSQLHASEHGDDKAASKGVKNARECTTPTLLCAAFYSLVLTSSFFSGKGTPEG